MSNPVKEVYLDAPSAGDLPNHADGRTRKEVGRVLVGRERLFVLLELQGLLEEQYKIQWRKWRFFDEHCERVVGVEQEQREREEIEREAQREYQRIVTAGLKRAGRPRRAARPHYGYGSAGKGV